MFFLISNSPGRPSKEVNVVAGDGFYSQIMINRFGFVNAQFLTDWFHLFKTGLTDRFGESGYGVIKAELFQIIKSKSEAYFSTALSNARLMLQRMSRRDLELEKLLEIFAQEKETYAQFCLDKIKGTRGLHSSSMSKQNHSSTL